MRPIADFVFCLSLAHLCFLRYWDEFQDHAYSYFIKTPPGRILQVATVLDTLVLALLFWAVAQYVRRTRNPHAYPVAGACLILLLICVPINTVRKRFLQLSFFDLVQSWGFAAAATAVVVLACATVYVLWRHLRTVIAAGKAAVWILAFLPVVNVVQTMRVNARATAADLKDKPGVSSVPNSAGRIVVIVFDEMDRGLLLARPPRIQMPAWERLEGESWSAQRAASGAESTLEAIPSLLAGRRVIKATPQSPDALSLQWEDPGGGVTDWKQTPTLFSEARKRGLNTGIAGWYHPYCRVFGDTTASCFWASAFPGVLHREDWVFDTSVGRAAWLQMRRILTEIPGMAYVSFLKPDVGVLNAEVRTGERTRTLREYEDIHNNALRAIADPALNVIFLHYPVPHMLAIYDAATDSFSAADGNNYFDNLRLADRSLAELRGAAERAGVWDRTSVLVTSDHPLRIELYRVSPEWDAEQEAALARARERRVPFLLKLAGQTRGMQYAEPVSTVVLKDLALAVLAGEVNAVEDVGTWLGKRAK